MQTKFPKKEYKKKHIASYHLSRYSIPACIWRHV